MKTLQNINNALSVQTKFFIGGMIVLGLHTYFNGVPALISSIPL